MASRVRYDRLTAVATAGLVTLVAVLGGLGFLPTSSAQPPVHRAAASLSAAKVPAARSHPTPARPTAPPSVTHKAPAKQGAKKATTSRPGAMQVPLPPNSGDGRRVVFSQSLQHVWLVGSSNQVLRSYPVSGSLTDNLHPGTYAVSDKRMNAIGVDNSGTMTHFVVFTQGPTGAAIGFHDIPVKDGKKIQSWKALGTPQSHGCIRQTHKDAVRLWDFTNLGTTVVVIA